MATVPGAGFSTCCFDLRPRRWVWRHVFGDL
jgi:hypothetical protein